MMLFPRLDSYVSRRVSEFDGIPTERRALLEKLARYVDGCKTKSEGAKLVFICTHNSRRSHMSQIWAQAAAHYNNVANVKTFSGGTEATAFHVNAVAAMRRAGFVIEEESPGYNPTYSVRFNDDLPPMRAFSKVFGEPPNPTLDFGAVMTCSQADEACPTVAGASFRIAVPYEDPKDLDGTGREAQTYDERCRQISREMLWTFSLLA
jgi:protein-tyrosine-phosphatase